MSDPLGAEGLRAAVLLAWEASPQRLREDANAEEDHARGWYRDRVVVELAQNAADAATRAGVPGRLLLRLTGRTLVAANTGAPLDPAGLASLASLRASAKHADEAQTVGRFGVGFAAVRSVADDVTVDSRTGAVHFSLAGAAHELAGRPALADLVAERGDALPVLRLPFAGRGAGAAPRTEPWDTVVVLTLRDGAAERDVRAQLAAVGDPLLLALPGLARLDVEVDGELRTVADVADRWVTASRSGELPAALLADRPVEERDRRAWRLTWAVPRTGAIDPRDAVVHAPTPTDDPTSVPALLVGSFPLDPSRRRVAAGPVTDALVAEAGGAWADLLAACRAERAAGREAPDPLDLVPVGWPAGPVDAALREAVLAATRTAPVLTAAGDGHPLAPADAVVLAPPWTSDARLVAVLGRWHASLVALPEARRPLVRVLRLRTVDLAEVVEQLPATDPAALREVYDVAGAGPGAADALGAAPVPLRDARVVHGPRGLVVLDGPVDDDALDALGRWGVRVVHPDAAHPVLERLGARRAGAGDLARLDVLRARVLDGDEEAAEVLLALVTPGADPEPWWGEALLASEDDDVLPARGLVLPGSDAAAWLDPDDVPAVAAGAVERWGAARLATVGVRRGLVARTVRADDEDAAETLDGWADYVAEHDLAGADVDLLAVADLDVLRDGAWPAALAALARPPLRAALDPVRTPDGRAAPSYTAWWLRDALRLLPFALPGADVLPGLLGPVPDALAGLDPQALRRLGGVAAVDDLDAGDWVAALGALAEGAAVPPSTAVATWRALAALALAGEDLSDVAALPALVDGTTPAGGTVAGVQAESGAGAVRVAPAEDVVVADPLWAQRTDLGPRVVVPTSAVRALADALDVDPAPARAAGRPDPGGTRRPVPDAVRALVPHAPAAWMHDPDLRVDGVPVAWWDDDGVPWARDAVGGLSRALAHATRWGLRAALERVLADRGATDAVLTELAGDDA